MCHAMQVSKYDLWDDVTHEPRCLITNGLLHNGEVVARTFCNFHHHDSKHVHHPAKPHSFTVHEKLDEKHVFVGLLAWRPGSLVPRQL